MKRSGPPAPLKSRDEHGIVLHVGTMSKSVSPGLRIGWVAGPEPVIERLADIKMQTDYGSSSLSQQAAKMWFASGMHLPHLNEIRQRLRERRDAMLALLDVYWPDIADWSKPEGLLCLGQPEVAGSGAAAVQSGVEAWHLIESRGAV